MNNAPPNAPMPLFMKITAILKGEKDSLGRHQVYIRKSDHQKRTYFSTGIRIEKKYWDKKVVKHPNAKALNDQIQKKIRAVEDSKKDSDIKFHTYALQCLSSWENSKKPETIRSIQNRVDKFNEFFSGKLSSVDAQVLTGYVNYCYSLKNKTNTVWSALKVVRTIIYKAYKEKLITENPFVSFEMPRYKDPPRLYLTKEQVDSIEKFVRGKVPAEYKIAGGWFLISCYTGLRFSDLTSFTKSKIKGDRLIVYTSKTGQVVSLPMVPKLKELFTMVGYKPLPYTNVHANRIIKAIAGEIELGESISFHTARHTCATMLAAAGVSIEVTAKILGHNSIKTTSIYYQITGNRIDKELEKIF